MTKENILIGTKSQHVKDNVNKVFDGTMLNDRINILYLDDVNLDYYTNLDNISYEDNALSSAMYYAEKSKINIVIGLSYALEIECWDFEKPKDLYCLSDENYTKFIEDTKQKLKNTKCSSCDYSSIACLYINNTRQTEFGYGFLDGFFKPEFPKGNKGDDLITRFDDIFYIGKSICDDVNNKGNFANTGTTKAEIDKNKNLAKKYKYADPVYQSLAVLYEKMKAIV